MERFCLVKTATLSLLATCGAVTGLVGVVVMHDGCQSALTILRQVELFFQDAVEQAGSFHPTNTYEVNLVRLLRDIASSLDSFWSSVHPPLTVVLENVDRIGTPVACSFFAISALAASLAVGASVSRSNRLLKTYAGMAVVLSLVGWLLFGASYVLFIGASGLCNVKAHVDSGLPAEVLPATAFRLCTSSPGIDLVQFSSVPVSPGRSGTVTIPPGPAMSAASLRNWLKSTPTNHNVTFRFHLNDLVQQSVIYRLQVESLLDVLKAQSRGLSAFASSVQKWKQQDPSMPILKDVLLDLAQNAQKKVEQLLRYTEALRVSKYDCPVYRADESVELIDSEHTYEEAVLHGRFDSAPILWKLKCHSVNFTITLLERGLIDRAVLNALANSPSGPPLSSIFHQSGTQARNSDQSGGRTVATIQPEASTHVSQSGGLLATPRSKSSDSDDSRVQDVVIDQLDRNTHLSDESGARPLGQPGESEAHAQISNRPTKAGCQAVQPPGTSNSSAPDLETAYGTGAKAFIASPLSVISPAALRNLADLLDLARMFEVPASTLFGYLEFLLGGDGYGVFGCHIWNTIGEDLLQRSFCSGLRLGLELLWASFIIVASVFLLETIALCVSAW